MALRDFRGRANRTTAEYEAAASAHSETYLDQGCELIGELRFEGTVRIDGRVEGEVRAAKQVIVGEAATVEAGIWAESVEIHGTVRGDIQVERKATLHASSRVSGEIRTVGIVIEEGARFQGSIVIGEPETEAGTEPEPDATPAEGATPKDEIAA